MNPNEEKYLQFASTVLTQGHCKHDRTNTGTNSIFGYQIHFDLQAGFPILTTKKVPFGLIKSEFPRSFCERGFLTRSIYSDDFNV